ncbi:MAG: WYL domain-containing protein [Desulfobacterales bacterium]|nr:WYL domain-containing protein [Desulfobacterales bacterium]
MKKRNIRRSYGEKLISLFARLLFSRESHSLTDLARMLNCSKQTVLRLVGDIQKAYLVNIEENLKGNRKYYRINRRFLPSLFLTETEVNVLYMCRTFAEHLLGHEQFEEATRALLKSRDLLPEKKTGTPQHFASFRPGSIDYTPHQNTIRTIIEAMEKHKICKINYRALGAEKGKTFYIKPLKLFSHQDTVYLHARKARTPGKQYKTPDFDPLLAVHRIKKVGITEKDFEFPKNYDFEKLFNRQFGIIKEDTFKVTVEFSGWAANYAAERIWSPDQKITKKKGGNTLLTFTASSEPELISWLLSFGDEAKLLKPKRLVAEVGQTVEQLQRLYSKNT